VPAHRRWLELLGRLLLVALYVLAAAATVEIVRADPVFALAGGSAALLAAELVVGGVLLLLGLSLLRPGARFGLLLALAAIAWPAAEWNTPAAGAAFTGGLVLSTAWAPLLAAAALRGPDERRLTRPAIVLVGLGVAASIGVLGFAAAVNFDPADRGCAQCPVNWLLVRGDAGAWSDLARAGLVLTIAWTVGFALFAIVRLARSTPPRRRLTGPVLLPAAVALALLGVDALHGVGRGFLSNDTTDRALWAGEVAALALVGAGVATGRVRARRRRTELARLVVDIGAASPGSLRERLATLLHDPSLELFHQLDEEAGWIDGEGRRATPTAGAGRQVTYVAAGGRRISALVHRAGLLDDPAMVAEIEVTARLALENERLHALRQAQLDALRAASGRIVERGDGERRRLERDLHDGAQQRLVTVALGVRLARRRHVADDPTLEAELAEVETELNRAVGELRRIAEGLFPAALDAEGLAAAIELLAEQEPRLVTGALPGGRCTPAVESAAYYLVDQSLLMASSGDVTVDAHRRHGQLLVELRAASGFGALPVRVVDRIGAVGGAVVADPAILQAELPCAS
jgi:signal transduction histidine kinase